MVLLAAAWAAAHDPVLVSLLAGLAFFYYLLIQPFVLSPYRTVPGPYWNRILRLPALVAQKQNRWVATVHQLHQKYGNVVLVAPGEVSLNGDTSYLHDLYTKNMPKLRYYSSFRSFGHDNLFSTMDNRQHLAYKRMLQAQYLKHHVFNAENTALLRLKIGLLVAEAVLQRRVDVYLLFGLLALDVVTAFELGAENGSGLLADHGLRGILREYRVLNDLAVLRILAPLWEHVWTWLRPSLARAQAAVDRWHRRLFTLPSRTYELLSLRGIEGNHAFAFLSDNILAGHETTAVLLTYLCYELSRPVNRARQQRLRRELATADLHNQAAIDRLPYLAAVLQETFRVHTLGPGPMPRVCPAPYPAGDVVLPKGTIVLCQLYLYHRDELVFPNAMCFVPERWLQGAELDEAFAARTARMNRRIMAFGRGVRMCLGKNLAIAEMKMAVAHLYVGASLLLCSDWCSVTHYPENVTVGDPIRLGPGSCGDSDECKMEMVDSIILIRPNADECYVRWSTGGP